MITAVMSRLKDEKIGNLRSLPEVTAVMEGIERKQGLTVQKKAPTTDEHVIFVCRLSELVWEVCTSTVGSVDRHHRSRMAGIL